ncbi:MAG: DUF370 domain-containing protein [Eubacteriales bacterium]|nr:DUF370 domain-containing protein [Eubacteriales bacterium]
MELQFIEIGEAGMVSAARLIALLAPDSAPVRRLIQEARERNVLVDCSRGNKTRSVLIMDSDHVILSAEEPEVIAARLAGKED